MNTKFKLLDKWTFENGITLLPGDILDIVSYGDDRVCIGHPSFYQVIWVNRIEFDGNCISLDFK